jgi:hypothetical protein
MAHAMAQRRDTPVIGKAVAMLLTLATLVGSLKTKFSFELDARARQEGYDDYHDAMSQMGLTQAVRLVGGAVITIALVVIVVNEVLTINAINNSSGPFSGVIDSLNTTGVAAMTLLVVGLVVVAGRVIMGFMGGGDGF